MKLNSKRSFSASIALLSFLSFQITALAQFEQFVASNQRAVFATMSSDTGASSQFFITYSISKSGGISGQAIRYDFRPNSASAQRSSGTTVTIVRKSSQLGLPKEFNRFGGKNLGTDRSDAVWRCPFMIKLSDGAVIKGILERPVRTPAPVELRMDGVITYKGMFGSKLSHSEVQ